MHALFGEDDAYPLVNSWRNRKPTDLHIDVNLPEVFSANCHSIRENDDSHQSLKDFPYKVRQNAHGLREKRTRLAGVVPQADAAKSVGLALGTTGFCHL